MHQASSDVDGRLRTVHPSGPKFGLRPSISWTDSDTDLGHEYNFEVGEWTDFLRIRTTDHLNFDH